MKRKQWAPAADARLCFSVRRMTPAVFDLLHRSQAASGVLRKRSVMTVLHSAGHSTSVLRAAATRQKRQRDEDAVSKATQGGGDDDEDERAESADAGAGASDDGGSDPADTTTSDDELQEQDGCGGGSLQERVRRTRTACALSCQLLMFHLGTAANEPGWKTLLTADPATVRGITRDSAPEHLNLPVLMGQTPAMICWQRLQPEKESGKVRQKVLQLMQKDSG
eukprot:gene6348-2961_t